MVEKKEAEVRAAAQAAVRRKQEEDAAWTTAAEKEAAARRAEAERLAKEQMAEEARAREAQTAAEQRAGAEREEMEERNKATASRGLAGGEWRTWVEKQKKFKTEVIEVVKADRAMKTGLRTVMRLITRGLGQVVNTREGVMRVVSIAHITNKSG